MLLCDLSPGLIRESRFPAKGWGLVTSPMTTREPACFPQMTHVIHLTDMEWEYYETLELIGPVGRAVNYGTQYKGREKGRERQCGKACMRNTENVSVPVTSSATRHQSPPAEGHSRRKHLGVK